MTVWLPLCSVIRTNLVFPPLQERGKLRSQWTAKNVSTSACEWKHLTLCFSRSYTHRQRRQYLSWGDARNKLKDIRDTRKEKVPHADTTNTIERKKKWHQGGVALCVSEWHLWRPQFAGSFFSPSSSFSASLVSLPDYLMCIRPGEKEEKEKTRGKCVCHKWLRIHSAAWANSMSLRWAGSRMKDLRE